MNNRQPPTYADFPRAAGALRDMLAAGELGFLGSAVSHWHALGVEAWVKHLRDGGDERPGAVVLIPHARDGLLIGPEDLPFCRADGRVTLLAVRQILGVGGVRRLAAAARLSPRLLRLWLARPGADAGEPLPVASVQDTAAGVFALAAMGAARLLRRRAVRFVVLDEGLGSYTDPHVKRHGPMLERPREGRIVPVRWLDGLLYAAWHGLERRIAAGYDVEHRFAFRRTPSGELAANGPVAADYAAVTRLGADPAAWPARRGRPVALVLPQPYSEARQVDAAAERAALEGVVRRLEAAGFDVWLKPHPRERAGKYDGEAGEWCRLLGGAQAVERLLAALGAGDVVVSINSTALLTARLLFGLDCCTYGPALLRGRQAGRLLRDAQGNFQTLAGLGVEDFDRRFGPLT